MAGVSTATVSRVINGSPLVVPGTREKVYAAMQALKYHPSHAARTLARQRTDTLGVVFPDIDTGFFVKVLKGLDQEASRRGFQVLTSFAHSPKEEEELVERFLLGGRVDGLILLNLNPKPRSLGAIGESTMPVVIIGAGADDVSANVVSQDNVGGAEAAMGHLLAHGYRRIWIVRGPKDSNDSRERLEGCRRAYAAAGLKFDAEVLDGKFRREGGEQIAENWLASSGKAPEAVFALNDTMALGVMKVLQSHGYKVPGDVAVVGYDDTETAEFAGLTSVHAPMDEMGKAAADLLIDAITRKQEGLVHQVFPTHLVVRTSCGVEHR